MLSLALTRTFAKFNSEDKFPFYLFDGFPFMVFDFTFKVQPKQDFLKILNTQIYEQM